MKLRETSQKGTYCFKCPGCNSEHVISTYTPNGMQARWTFNKSMDKPTFSPSYLLRSGHYSNLFKPNDSCWCTYNKEHKDNPAPFSCVICHSFIVDGKIQFLSDCTHHLAGQTVELEDYL